MAGDDATDERKVQVVGKRRCVQLVNDVQEFVSRGFRNQPNDAPSPCLGESARVTMFPKSLRIAGSGPARSEGLLRVAEAVPARDPPREIEQRG